MLFSTTPWLGASAIWPSPPRVALFVPEALAETYEPRHDVVAVRKQEVPFAHRFGFLVLRVKLY